MWMCIQKMRKLIVVFFSQDTLRCQRMPKNVKMMQEKDAKIKDLEEKCKKLVSLMYQL